MNKENIKNFIKAFDESNDRKNFWEVIGDNITDEVFFENFNDETRRVLLEFSLRSLLSEKVKGYI